MAVPATRIAQPYTAYEQQVTEKLRKIESQLNNIRMLLWCLGLFLPLMIFAVYAAATFLFN